MKKEIDVKPAIGAIVPYVPVTGPVIDLTIEKVIDDNTIDGVSHGPARSGTPIRFSSIKHDPSGAPNTWCFPEEVKYGSSLRGGPAASTTPKPAGAPPPPPPPPSANLKGVK